MNKISKFLFITGLSGSGKSSALKVFEDLRYFCMDNFPLQLIKKFVEIIENGSFSVNNVAIVCDVREIDFENNFFESIGWLKEKKMDTEILFLKASESKIINRYQETRRQHPLSIIKSLPLLDAIHQEKCIMESIEKISSFVIDTSDLNTNHLKNLILSKFGNQKSLKSIVQLVSFGFKYGLPTQSDYVFDVRFLPNPYFIESLKYTTGLDNITYEFVLNQKEAKKFIIKLEDFLRFVLPLFSQQAKSYVTISIGCTGGKHRSVAIVKYLENFLKSINYIVNVIHRDIGR